MKIFLNTKNWLKGYSIVRDNYTRLAGWLESNAIHKEEQIYKTEAEKRKIQYSESVLGEQLLKKIIENSLSKKSRKYHTFAAFHNYNWEGDSLIPALNKFGEVTWYDWQERGFDPFNNEWLSTERKRMNLDLLNRIRELHDIKPIDLFFGYGSNLVFSSETIQGISKLGILTVGMSLDDHSGFKGKKWNGIYLGQAPLAKAFDISCTSSLTACTYYMVEGGLPLFFPEGANPEIHKNYSLKQDIEVSFVGQAYGYRTMLINFLKKNGIGVTVFGKGWPGNSVFSNKDIVKIYNRSKINLGFGAVLHTKNITCLKGRDFEIPMSGGFYLTQYNPELELCYDIGKEIVCYHSWQDMVQKIKYYLNNSEERKKISLQGMQRALREHTWEVRFKKIFDIFNLV